MPWQIGSTLAGCRHMRLPHRNSGNVFACDAVKKGDVAMLLQCHVLT